MLVANLDAEEPWRQVMDPHLPRGPLPRRVLERLSAVGSLMRVLAEPGEPLWTLAPLDPGRLPAHPGLPTPQLISGAVATRDARTTWAMAPPWSAIEPSRIAAGINHRRFGLELRRSFSGDDGSCMVSGTEELPSAIDRLAGRWVLKAPLSAAGRDRFVSPPPPLDVEQIASSPTIGRLFRRHGELALEPWVERVTDYGVLFDVSDGALEPDVHRQIIDEAGRFLGIELNLSTPPEHVAGLHAAAETIGRAAHARGYRGPISLDAWSFIDAAGQLRLQPIGEINARWSVGRLARAWAAALDIPPTEPVRWRLGSGSDMAGALLASERHWPLLYPGPGDRDAIWMEKLTEKLAPASNNAEPT